METGTITFDALPGMVAEMSRKQAEMSRKLDLLLSGKTEMFEERDYLMTIEELQEFLPEKPARQTIYQKVNSRLIPSAKLGRRLYFRKSSIDNWLRNGRQIS